MPRQKIADFFREKIFALRANRRELSAEAVARLLRETAKKDGVKDAPPSSKTVRRYWEEFENLGHKQRDYTYVLWPETMESEVLPWEASRVVLDLIAECEKRKYSKPSVALAKWFWRVTLAAPEMSLQDRMDITAELDYVERFNRKSDPKFADLRFRTNEFYLAFQSKKLKVETDTQGNARVTGVLHGRCCDWPGCTNVLPCPVHEGVLREKPKRGRKTR